MLVLVSDKSYIFLLQKINFTEPFFAPPVAVVTPKRIYNNKSSGLSTGSGCDAITAWIEVRCFCCCCCCIFFSLSVFVVVVVVVVFSLV